MITTNEIFIAADAHTVYELAHDTARWPELLPHYRFVHTLKAEGNKRIVHMGARRDWIPVQWTAEQIDDASKPQIRFTHIAGWTKGMDVIWYFDREAGGTCVRIVHELTFSFPFASKWIADHIVGAFFIHSIAGKTLARMKQLAEQTR